MEEVKFSTGDVVRLKSGGPRMTVSGISHGQDGVLTCEFFVGNELRQHAFDEPMLALAWAETTCAEDDPSFGFLMDETFDDLPAYDHIGEESHGPALSDEELDTLMYISEAQQYGGRSR